MKKHSKSISLLSAACLLSIGHTPVAHGMEFFKNAAGRAASIAFPLAPLVVRAIRRNPTDEQLRREREALLLTEAGQDLLTNLDNPQELIVRIKAISDTKMRDAVLWRAVTENFVSTVRALLEAGVQPRSNLLFTAIDYAACTCVGELAKKADITVDLLLYAASKANTAPVLELLDAAREKDAERMNVLLNTALKQALDQNDGQAFKSLIEFADLQECNSQLGLSHCMLCYALEQNKDQVLEPLFAKGVRFDDSQASTTEMRARQQGNTAACDKYQELLKRRTSNLFQLIAQRDYAAIDLRKFELKETVNTTCPTLHKKPLLSAIESRDRELVALLLRMDARVGEQEFTAAVRARDIELFESIKNAAITQGTMHTVAHSGLQVAIELNHEYLIAQILAYVPATALAELDLLALADRFPAVREHVCSASRFAGLVPYIHAPIIFGLIQRGAVVTVLLLENSIEQKERNIFTLGALIQAIPTHQCIWNTAFKSVLDHMADDTNLKHLIPALKTKLLERAIAHKEYLTAEYLINTLKAEPSELCVQTLVDDYSDRSAVLSLSKALIANMQGRTPQSIRFIMGRHADIFEEIKTDLLIATINDNDLGETRALLERGANHSCRTYPLSPLGYATDSNNTGMIHLLLEFRAHPSSMGTDGKTQTPLMRAARHGNKEAVELMLARNPATSYRDRSGKSAFDYAREGGHTAVIELLQKHGTPAAAH